MFNKDFYPTPKEVIERTLIGHDMVGKHVLEPSAGKGNILDVVNNLGANTICCEKNEELAKIASTKARFLKYDLWMYYRKK